MIALVLSILPALLWDGSPSSAPDLQKAGIREIAVAGDPQAWSGSGVRAVQVDVSKLVKLDPVGIDYQPGVSGATGMPWINSNLWRMLRDRQASFLYEGSGPNLPRAIAEAYTGGAHVYFRVKPEDLESFAAPYRFLVGVNGPALPSRVNFRLVDDGSPDLDEIMNLLVRRNLLFDTERGPSGPGMHVRIGSSDYPKNIAEDPYVFAAVVRGKIGDDNRLVRVYGSETILARLFGDEHHARLHLIQYGRRPAQGLRVRVVGRYARVYVKDFGQNCVQAADVLTDDTGTEFTIPELRTFAIVDLDGNVPGTLRSSYVAADTATLNTDPNSDFWRAAPRTSAASDTFGQTVGLGPMEVRSRWSPKSLYVLYLCPFERLNLRPDPMTDRETPSLWNWDVAEAFIGGDPADPGHYREFELSPQGEWVDLDIDCKTQEHRDLWNSGMQVSSRIDRDRKIWYGVMRIPISAIRQGTPRGGDTFWLGLYRSSGPSPNTKYVSWQPTYSRTFHVPASFGKLILEDSRD